jgi:hypothetical protein
MTDIGEKLRLAASDDEAIVSVRCLRADIVEAADEIEQLRAALWQAREDLAHLVQQVDVALLRTTGGADCAD